MIYQMKVPGPVHPVTIELRSGRVEIEGVQSVGVDRVIERAGVAKASLYSTFGSKEELVRAYLDERHAQILGRLRTGVDAVDPSDPVARILAVFDAQARIFRARGFRGCAFAAAAAEAPRDGRIGEATRSYRREIRELFTELATAAGADDPALLASQLQALCDGGGSAANLDRNPAIARAVRAAAESLIALSVDG